VLHPLNVYITLSILIGWVRLVRLLMIIMNMMIALNNYIIGLYRSENTGLKGRIRVQFTSETGTAEAGIDGGGLFKDFIDNFTKSAFHPSAGLFVLTSEQLLTPNPASSLVNEDSLELYHLFGKVLGKAVYEVSDHSWVIVYHLH